MSDLADFLLARIAEDEAVVYGIAPGLSPGPWRNHMSDPDAGGQWSVQARQVAPGKTNAVVVSDAAPWSLARGSTPAMAHVARWDPARVLAECEAKRRIVELNVYAYDDPPYRYCLRLLALPYADHPDYQESWRA